MPNAELRHMQVILGHASVATTQIYTHVSIGHLRERLQRCHPRERDNLTDKEPAMTRMQAQDLAKRIQILPDAEQIKILSRVMKAEGKKVGWSEVERIQQRMAKLKVDEDQLTRDIVESVREVRRERRRKSRS
jgi:hypothetical protein